MSDVPPDILVIVLSRLPVKSLLRFRAVSKTWRALIDSPYFVNLHRQQSMKTDKLLCYTRGVGYSTPFSFLSLDSHLTSVEMKPPFDRTVSLHGVDSCHGLICLRSVPLGKLILLWNPSTRRYRLIDRPTEYPPSHSVLIPIDQIGYDNVNDDYKVVRLTQSSASVQLDSKVFVYSLKFNVWQSVEQRFPYNFLLVRCSGQGVCVNGVIHWLLNQKSGLDKDYLIVSFDLASQNFQSVPLPECFNNYVSIDLGELGGCLCVVGVIGMLHVDLWVMREYAVKESWSKLVALTLRFYMMRGLPSVKPIKYLKNHKEVLLEVNGRWLAIYDLEEKEYKQTTRFDVSVMSTFVYHESLL